MLDEGPTRLKTGSSIASVAVSTTGMYFGQAPGHHGVGGDLADGDLAAPLWQLADDLARGAAGALNEFRDAGLGGRHDGQAGGPAKVVAALDGLEGRVPLDGCGFANFTQGLLAPMREFTLPIGPDVDRTLA